MTDRFSVLRSILPGSFTLFAIAACAAGPGASGDAPPLHDPLAQAVRADPETLDSWWANLQRHCGRAFPGELGVEPPGDEMLEGDELLVAHFRDCDDREMKIAFHIEQEGGARWDRSRTWVLRRIGAQIELRHDHRLEDGAADWSTWYGGFSRTPGTATDQTFDFIDGEPIPGVDSRGWRLEIEPEARYSYGTVRNGEWRWRVDFDLSRSVHLPPPAWGHAAPDRAAQPGEEEGEEEESAAASPPATDIHLVSITQEDGRIILGEPTDVTAREGYDNQPSFTADGAAILYTSIREDGQADVYRYDIGTGATRRITSTPESEYSPTVTPRGDGVSTVRVEPDSTQRLWRFPLDGGAPALILEDVAPVGYHAWGDAGRLALFVLGSPPTLQLADPRSGGARVIASDIGRAMQRMPGTDTIAYLVHVPPAEWRVTGMDFRTGGSRHMVVALEGSQDFAWTPDRTLLMASGNAIHAWREGGEGWTEVHRFDAPSLQRITRLAVSPDGALLALVGDRQIQPR